MYAVIKTGGKQYRVAQGDVIKVERLNGERGNSLTFDHVLMLGNSDETKIGAPLLEGASVKGTIVEQGRDRKLIVFKFRRRKNYIRKNGHRQYYTRVRIDAIEG